MADSWENKLYYGDNLEILRKYIPNESVDLIYLDPPFNSKADYNVLFKEPTGQGSTAQIEAFTDSWHWNPAAEKAYDDIIVNAPLKVSKAIEALREFIGSNDVMAYLAMMTLRLVELHRVLKPTGSLYLHCDPTASHYLKVVLDTIFGPKNFRNEVIWQRTLAKGLMSRRLPDNHDLILYYGKSGQAVWNSSAMFTKYDVADLPEKTTGKYSHRDDDGRLYQLSDITNPNHNRPNLTYEFLGITKVWRWTKARMQAAYDAGLIVQPSPGSVPRFKRYLDEQRGLPLGTVWIDIPPLNSQAKERLGYPTQKPEALLERIIRLSSNEGDVVLDPFCGCGTAVIAAQKLNRRWIGIDITHLAITVMRKRLQDSFPGIEYEVVGEPKDLEGAKALARQDRYQFQWWALSLVNALPQSGEKKKGADEGIDGVITFIHDNKGKASRVIIQVKSGSVTVKDIREMKSVIGSENLGLFITLQSSTEPMRTEAATAGFYHWPLYKRDYPRIQILTIEELLSGQKPDLPYSIPGFAKAKKIAKGKQMSLAGE